jgi:hypothetical protein
LRDPDLVVRAQRAATALERAWDRWRTLHGLSAEPMPPASSYVGYSLAEPWGQPRVVFGVAAEDAEQLAALLDRHECAGPAGTHQLEPAGRTSAGVPSAGVRSPGVRSPGVQSAGHPPAPRAPLPSPAPLPPRAPARPPERSGAAAGPAAAEGRPEPARPHADGGNGDGVHRDGPAGANGHGALDSRSYGGNGNGRPGNWAYPAANGHPASGSRPDEMSSRPDGINSGSDAINGHGAPGSRADLTGPAERPEPAVQAVLPLHPAPPVPPAPVTSPVQPGEGEPGAGRPGAGQPGDGQPGWTAEARQPPPAHAATGGSHAAMTAFRPGAEPASSASSPLGAPAPDAFADDDQVTGGPAARRPRSHRHAAGHATQTARQKRASAAAERDAVPLARPAALPQAASRRRDSKEGRDQRGLTGMAGDLAGWASGELPGQARRQPPPWTVATGPGTDAAEPPGTETRRDNAS